MGRYILFLTVMWLVGCSSILGGGSSSNGMQGEGSGQSSLPSQIESVNVSYEITFQNGDIATDQQEVSPEEIFETVAGPLRVTVVWEQFTEAMEPTPTFVLRNTFYGNGVVRWINARITVGDKVFDLGDHGCMPPRYAVIQTALTLDDWRMLPNQSTLPSWVAGKALQEIENHKQNWIGPYQFWSNDSSPDVAGGARVAPFHGGQKDWLTNPEGLHMRLAEAMGSLSRGIWLDYDPGDQNQLYWWDASAINYAPEGYRWQPDTSGWCAYEQQLAQRPIADISHGRRFYGAATALAAVSKIGRYFLMEAIWPEIKRSYSMDPRIPPTNHPDAVLYSPLWQILELTAPGGPYAPPNWSGWGNRREAHAANVVYEAIPYMTQEDFNTYVPAWAQFLEQLDDGRGVLDRSFSGDATNSGLPPPVALAFHQQLLFQALKQLGDYNSSAMETANRIKNWWQAFPPYFAHSGPGYHNANDAPHSGQSVANYTWFTHPETANCQEILANASNHGLDESPLDCLPPEARCW